MRHGLSGWSGHLHSGQNTSLHCEEEHEALSVCRLPPGLGPDEAVIGETRLGAEQLGQVICLSPSESFLPSSLNNMWRTLDGETMMEAEWFLSLLALVGEVQLLMLTIALLGEILREKKFSLPRFSLSIFILDMKASLRSSCLLNFCKADLQVVETWHEFFLEMMEERGEVFLPEQLCRGPCH